MQYMYIKSAFYIKLSVSYKLVKYRKQLNDLASSYTIGSNAIESQNMSVTVVIIVKKRKCKWVKS